MLANLQAIHGAGGLIIAVGERGTARHFDGESWRMVPTRSAADLTGVHVISKTEAYAVGTNGTLLHWDGTTWNFIKVDTEADLYTIGGAFPHMWIGGGGVLFHWTALDREPELCLESNEWMRAIWAPDGEPHRPFVLTNHRLTRWDVETGVDPVDLNVPIPRGVYDLEASSHGGGRAAELYALAASSPEDIWVTGNGVAYHYNGTGWSSRMVGAEAIFGVCFARSGEAVAVTGCGRVLLWRGDDWRERKVIKRAWLGGVCVQDGVAFVVGQDGTLFSIQATPSEFNELREYLDPVVGEWVPVWNPQLQRTYSSVWDPNFREALKSLGQMPEHQEYHPEVEEKVPNLVGPPWDG